jgi:hypothetical protein
MELGFYPLGEPHGVNRLSSLQKRVVEDLAYVGLVYIQKVSRATLAEGPHFRFSIIWHTTY